MTRKRLLWLLGFGLLFAAALLWKSPEGRLASQLSRVSTALSYARDEAPAARSERFRETLARWLDDGSQVQVAGAGTYSGGEASLRALDLLVEHRPQAYFELERLEVKLDRDHEATAVGLLNVSDSQVGDLHRDQRRLDVTLVDTGSGWRIKTLRIGEADNAQPWERP